MSLGFITSGNTLIATVTSMYLKE